MSMGTMLRNCRFAANIGGMIALISFRLTLGWMQQPPAVRRRAIFPVGAREVLVSETTRVHHAARRRGSRVAARGALSRVSGETRAVSIADDPTQQTTSLLDHRVVKPRISRNANLPNRAVTQDQGLQESEGGYQANIKWQCSFRHRAPMDRADDLSLARPGGNVMSNDPLATNLRCDLLYQSHHDGVG
jgi:hypothetical protein